jgi:hypothetical protein
VALNYYFIIIIIITIITLPLLNFPLLSILLLSQIFSLLYYPSLPLSDLSTLLDVLLHRFFLHSMVKLWQKWLIRVQETAWAGLLRMGWICRWKERERDARMGHTWERGVGMVTGVACIFVSALALKWFCLLLKAIW